MSANDIEKKLIRFTNQNEAVAVFSPPNTQAEALVIALNIRSYHAVFLILGDTVSIDENKLPQLTLVFSRGIARAAADAKAIIIDGGTQAGVMALMGKGVADRGYQSPQVGIVPADLVSYPGGRQPVRRWNRITPILLWLTGTSGAAKRKRNTRWCKR